MNLIDCAGLTDTPVPVEIYAKALRLEGWLVPGEERDLVLTHYRANPPDPGVVLFTGPQAARYWSALPAPIRVVIVPGDAEIPFDSRLPGTETGLLAWLLYCQGRSRSESESLAEKAPTERHRAFPAYLEARQALMAYQALPVEGFQVPADDWSYLGEIPAASGKRYEYVLVDSLKAYRRLAERLWAAVDRDEVIGLDIESDEEEDYHAKTVGVGLAFPATVAMDSQPAKPAESYYLPLNGRLGEELAVTLLSTYFVSNPLRFIAHNGKFDAQVLAQLLAPADPLPLLRRLTGALAGDGLVAAYCLARVDYQTGRPLPKDLKSLTNRYYNVRNLTFTEMLALSGATKASEAPLGDIGAYCGADAYWCVEVHRAVVADLQRFPKLLELYEKLELPTVAMVAEMEMLGLPLDVKKLEARRQEFKRRVEVYRRYLEEQAVRAGYQLQTKVKMCPLHSRKKADYEACPACDARGRVLVVLPFNPNSTHQVAAVLQGTLGLPQFQSTDMGGPSNDEPTLLRLREFSDNPDAKDWITFLLAFRKDTKVLGTYLDAFLEHKRHDLWQDDRPSAWFLHSTFNQAVVESGRFSSKKPNFENIPLSQRDLVVASV